MVFKTNKIEHFSTETKWYSYHKGEVNMKLTTLITGVILIVTSYSPLNAEAVKNVSRTDDKTSFSNYSNGKYRSKAQWKHPGIKESLSIAWDFLFKGGETTPLEKLPVTNIDLSVFDTTEKDQLNSTLVGHSSLMIHIDGFKILTDPVYQKRVSVAGPTRYNGEAPLALAALPEIDVVIISHNHYDHLNKYSVRLLKDKTSLFVVPPGLGKMLKRWGVKSEKIVELDWWDEFYYNDSLLIAATPAQHFSGRGLFDRNKTLWASWVISGPNHKVFFSGDSGYFDGFSEIGEKYGPFDMTFLECGAYDDKWKMVHMFPEQTVQAHLDLKGKILHPIHWGTFNLALHSWYDPMERFAAAADKKGIQYVTPETGGSVVYGSSIKTNKWWKAYVHKSTSGERQIAGSVDSQL